MSFCILLSQMTKISRHRFSVVRSLKIGSRSPANALHARQERLPVGYLGWFGPHAHAAVFKN
jgi:hypothetical protein